MKVIKKYGNLIVTCNITVQCTDILPDLPIGRVHSLPPYRQVPWITTIRQTHFNDLSDPLDSSKVYIEVEPGDECVAYFIQYSISVEDALHRPIKASNAAIRSSGRVVRRI